MDAQEVISWMLVAACLVAAVHHLLAWHGRAAARDHAWFGLVALATALAAGVRATQSPCAIACLAALAWSTAACGFIAAHAPAHTWRRHAAWWTPFLVAIAFLAGPLELTFDGTPPEPETRATLDVVSVLVGSAACALFVLLAIDACRNEWVAGRRLRAVALGGLALAALGWSGLHARAVTVPLQLPALCVVFVSVLAMAVELARTTIDAQAAAQRERQELAHASRLAVVGELTASIAHEISQPLGAILSNADAGEIMLERTEPPLEELRKILADIRRDGLRASDVIRQVRTLVRRRELDPQVLDAGELALHVALLLEEEARRRRIPLLTESPLRPAHVLGDRALLEQVLINLVRNALDAVETAIPDEGAFRPPVVLRVSVTPRGEPEWRIVDVGTGIPEDKLAQLFDSFYTSKPHGMGLGLSISRSIVEAHGGRIQASNNPGGGATFRVTLPPCHDVAPKANAAAHPIG
jgi:signal transduction histidine kinase